MEFVYWFDTLLDSKIIIVRVFGELFLEDFVTINKVFRQKAVELNYSLILDFKASINNLNYNQISYFKQFVCLQELDRYKHIPTVYLTNLKDKGIFEFIEAISIDYGLVVKCAQDERAATDWVTKLL